jgi:hypothetical protein
LSVLAGLLSSPWNLLDCRLNTIRRPNQRLASQQVTLEVGLPATQTARAASKPYRVEKPSGIRVLQVDRVFVGEA